MKTLIHKSDTRGHADHGWLKAKHTFSFANYYDPARVHFGALRVLNDDIIDPGKGFGTHPHDNMEIITIPLEGQLEHKDSMGNGSVISTGEIQHMSAGSGITHSEFNPSSTEHANILQIWIFPKLRNIEPVYSQVNYDYSSLLNKIVSFAGPESIDKKIQINQDAWVSLSRPQPGIKLDYTFNKKGNVLYIFVIEGEVNAAGADLLKRDGIGIRETNVVEILSAGRSFLLFLEVPDVI